MCPSFRATGEERYSTRGRARLLGEMLRGDVLTDGWQSVEVKDALDMCLACKGCRSDCPTHTDMASYKAEFLSHYYEQHARPLQAHSMGRIGEWAPLAMKAPGLVNGLGGLPFFSGLTKKLAGIAAQRSLPRFAQRSFRAQFDALQRGRRDPARTSGTRRGDPVILFPDTFSNHFRPQSALSAARVLEASGARVSLSPDKLCCGRPYYDFGMLDKAKAALEKIVAALGPQIESGVPVVILEPGCHSVFRDEMVKLLPGNECAAKLARQTVSLAELLQRRHWNPGRVGGRALLHGHCHQKALGGTRADVALLEAAGIETTAPETGCCGMAGAFGFRPDTYQTSVKIANLALLPKVKSAPAGTFIVANGFSCREQIEDLAGRETLHLADLLARTLA
jgi:Fe-S oxidoreductase